MRAVLSRLSLTPILHLLRRIPLGRFGWYLVAGALACVGAALSFASLAEEVLEDEFGAAEVLLLRWLGTQHTPVNDAIMLFFTHAGGPVGIGCMLALTAAALLYYGHRLYALTVAVAGVGAVAINVTLKAVFQRERPNLFGDPFGLTSYSFPSGHSLGAMVGFGMLAFVVVRLARHTALKLLALVLATLAILLVGLSRLYFGVHYPTDVVGGFIAGGTWLGVCILLMDTAAWHARRSRHATGAARVAHREDAVGD